MDFTELKNASDGKDYFNVNWGLTNKCNYECSYCHPDLSNGSIKPAEYEDISRFVDNVFEYCESKGVKPYFEFGGGEVTLFRWFSELIWKIKNQGGLVSIISNGSRPLHWWEKNVGALHGAFISYHSEFVKDKEHFKQVAKIIHESKTTRLQVNMMMNPEMFDECYEFAKEIKQEFNCIIALQPLYHGFGYGGVTKRFDYTDEQDQIMREFRGGDCTKALPEPRGLVSVKNEDGIAEVRSSFDLLVEQKTNFVGWDCNGGIENIVINFKGDIFRAWCMQDKSIGSIYDENLTLPTEPTLCRTKICQCGADICSTKVKRIKEENIIYKAIA